MYVFQQLEHLRDGFDSVTPHAVANALHWADDAAKRRAVVAALDFLSSGQRPILERRFELWAPQPSGDVLEEPVCYLSASDMRTAIEEGTLANPVTGENIPDFLQYVTIVYIVTDLAKRDGFMGLAAG